MIHFRKVKWKNFLSYGNVFTEVSLDRSPTTLVVGKNGSGKSTISDAITFVLYGKPFRKIKKDSLVNSINKKDCVVEIEFSIGEDDYKVIRGIKPNLFEIYQNGELIDQEAKNRDYQEYLESFILKINYKTFSQIIILGSSSYTPFMRLTTPQRREIIEDLLDIEIFSSMYDILKQRIKDLKQDIQKTEYDILLHEKDKKHSEESLAQAQENKQSQIDEYMKEGKELSSSIQKAQKKSGKIKKMLTDVLSDGIIESLEEKRKEEKQISINLLSSEKEKKQETKLISFLEENTSCPTCKQSIDETFRLERIEQHQKNITKHEEDIAERETESQNLREEMKVLQEKMQQAQELNRELSTIETLISSQKKTLKSRISKIESLKREQEGTVDNKEQENLEQIKKLLDDSREKSNNYTANLEMHKLLEQYFMKDTGIKADIIRKYLPIMNDTIDNYLSQMDFFVKFEIDENFNETIKSRHRDKFTYASFSEGEKQKIDIALLFTWREIAKLRNSINTNLLILDEIADSSLDNTSTTDLIKILKYQKGLNIFLISHKSGGDQGYDSFRSVMSVSKQNNFSAIE